MFNGIEIPKDVSLTKEEWVELYLTLSAFCKRVLERRGKGPMGEVANSIDALINSSESIVDLVEGPGCGRYVDSKGRRLKDTAEWARFYVAVKQIQRVL